MFFKTFFAQVSDGPFKYKSRINLRKMKSKRYGRDTIHAANENRLNFEVAKSNLEIASTNAGYRGILGERISECSGFLDPLTVALGTNVMPKRYREEISRKMRDREIDAISLLKLSENLNDKDFAEISAKKFHALLGELTPRETLRLTKVSRYFHV